MPALPFLLLGLAQIVGGEPPRLAEADLGQLHEMLLDRQNPRNQSQAALLLVQCPAAEAEKLVRQGLQQPEEPEVFLALAAATRSCQDRRFLEELIAALAINRPGVRQAAAEALAALPNPPLVHRLQTVVEDPKADAAVRQAALWTLGRCGRKQAAPVLLSQLGDGNEALKRAAAEALADLSGQSYGSDVDRWKAWWDRNKNLNNEQWLEQRLAYQSSRAHRLDGDLERARNQVLRLHQQFYNRLPAADRLAYIQSVVDQDDPAVRALAVLWSVEQLSATDSVKQHTLAQVLLKLSHDGSPEVQRAAVLGLGRLDDADSLERLRALLRTGRPLVRAAAARSLALQARVSGMAGQERQQQILRDLQKALEDPALEVVIEAAEDLGALGAPEAGPVLTGLLKHQSEPARQAAAQALERVADVAVLDRLVDALDDSSSAVRFSVLGAIDRAAGNAAPADALRQRLQSRLEDLLLHDADPGVRSRAATVLGECGSASQLQTLWRCVLTAEDGRVQEKAWSAFLEVLVRSGSLPLLQEWEHTLASVKQASRRLQLLNEVSARWMKNPERKLVAGPAQEILVQAQLEQGKWTAAYPQVRELLTRPASDVELSQRLQWLLTVGQQALQEGNKAEALRVAQEAQPYLYPGSTLSAEFQKLEKQATRKDKD